MNGNLAYKEERREELINGEVVAMSPPATNHNVVADNIHGIFWSHLRGKKCISFGDGEAVYFSSKDKFIPDFMIVCDRNKVKRNGVHGAPDLVAEILSPSTARNDRWHKKNIYESSGVPEYWLVDPLHKSVEVHLLRDGRYILDNIYTLYHDEELAEMTTEEKDAVVTAFKCHLYDDLVIRLEDIFTDLF